MENTFLFLLISVYCGSAWWRLFQLLKMTLGFYDHPFVLSYLVNIFIHNNREMRNVRGVKKTTVTLRNIRYASVLASTIKVFVAQVITNQPTIKP